MAAENDWKVDNVYIRPLSEIADDRGVVEDTRAIVPYQGDIHDMIDAVREFIEDEPRKININFSPDTFRAYRPDPVNLAMSPPGLENRLLAPRRGYWEVPEPSVKIFWEQARVTIDCPSFEHSTVIWKSVPVPVKQEYPLFFRCKVKMSKGTLKLTIFDLEGNPAPSVPVVSATETKWREIFLNLPSLKTQGVYLTWSYSGPESKVDIDFEVVRTPGICVGNNIKLPHQDRWEICSPGLNMAWVKNALHIEADDSLGSYLMKTFFVSCHQSQSINFPIGVQVERGVLGIGILGEDSREWVSKFSFQPGPHEIDLQFSTDHHNQFQVVLYSCQEEKLVAAIDWRNCLDKKSQPTSQIQSTPIPEPAGNPNSWMLTKERFGASHFHDQKKHDILKSDNVLLLFKKRLSGLVDYIIEKRRYIYNPPKALLRVYEILSPRFSRIWAKWVFAWRDWVVFWRNRVVPLLFGKKQFYCLKPWLDMNNFTVDGRMDVCCIATGQSQERYGLGNLLEKSFQEIWNGERIQEFRKTVNSKDKLPPCQRCPLAFVRQGPFFVPQYNATSIRLWLAYWPLLALAWVGVIPWVKNRTILTGK